MQFCQIRYAIYHQLLSIALASRREAFNKSLVAVEQHRSLRGRRGLSNRWVYIERPVEAPMRLEAGSSKSAAT